MFRAYKINTKGGFSFIELMIAVSIFGILSTITVSSYAQFNNRIGVDTLAHQIAQFGHEAQVSALSVKRSVNGSFPAYGIHFETASSSQMIFFADVVNGNLAFDSTGSCGKTSDECEKTINLLKGVKITALCGNTSGGTEDGLNCKYSDALHKSVSFDIAFKRPSPDANIYGKKTVGGPNVSYSTAQVIISSNKGYKRTVTFYITGQITVK